MINYIYNPKPELINIVYSWYNYKAPNFELGANGTIEVYVPDIDSQMIMSIKDLQDKFTMVLQNDEIEKPKGIYKKWIPLKRKNKNSYIYTHNKSVGIKEISFENIKNLKIIEDCVLLNSNEIGDLEISYFDPNFDGTIVLFSDINYNGKPISKKLLSEIEKGLIEAGFKVKIETL